MSDTSIIHELCVICEIQSKLISLLADRLSELGYTMTGSDEIEIVNERLNRLLGG